MRCYRLGILVQKNRGILLSWNLITDLESWYGLGLECIQVSGVDVLMYAVLLK